ncbi:SDR family oxidoreductase [Photobacterium sp. TY1-4]|uniref:SDR family oxidoreductase n=1 Tax=Photobacterium sp. TY1-4 TaxID=2899122 RepID=UPI0021C2033D|nr:SDR family oxidoreductase [Photobacterium sp. TY1-4]UXI00198.1 SDR family oxidoreductase [Photobacterium sp. TY1-4]
MAEMKPRVLLAGATGYLGRHLVKQLLNRDYPLLALARDPHRLKALGLTDPQIRIAQVTEPASLTGCCDNIDVVISCVGITRQRDGLGYMDVDFQANLNLLREAEKAGVRRFIYISALNAPNFQTVRLLRAKERFAGQLLTSSIPEPCVIRPNGFFSDMTEFYNMAKQGRVYLFGNGSQQLNPIHGDDLATFCLEAIHTNDRELDIGGPEILSHRQVAEIAFESVQHPEKVTFVPEILRKLLLKMSRTLPEKYTGTAEFFLTATAQDMIAPAYGERTLAQYFQTLNSVERQL